MASSTKTAAALALVGSLLLSGCGTPGAPQPPSLQLPQKVTDLTATRAGDSIILRWKMPRKTTDRLLIQGVVVARVCRQPIAATCLAADTVGDITPAPNTEAEFHDTLPAELRTGSARQITYFVELKNRSGRSAGLSNPAITLAGSAPAPIAALVAEARPDGVALHWQPDGATPVRLHRRLLTAAPRSNGSDLTKAPPEPPMCDLLVEPPHQSDAHDSPLSGAVDNTARFGAAYEYTAQRIDRVTVSGQLLELPGPVSAPVRIEVIDTFPPAIPTGLAAVFVTQEQGANSINSITSIDLSWQPDSDNDLAGYIVYRSERSERSETVGDWKRISPPTPIPTPAFRDSAVQSGHTYRYAVSAIDLTGHESKRSQSAEESVPNP